jgi:hypothetical protein
MKTTVTAWASQDNVISMFENSPDTVHNRWIVINDQDRGPALLACIGAKGVIHSAGVHKPLVSCAESIP